MSQAHENSYIVNTNGYKRAIAKVRQNPDYISRTEVLQKKTEVLRAQVRELIETLDTLRQHMLAGDANAVERLDIHKESLNRLQQEIRNIEADEQMDRNKIERLEKLAAIYTPKTSTTPTPSSRIQEIP